MSILNVSRYFWKADLSQAPSSILESDPNWNRGVTRRHSRLKDAALCWLRRGLSHLLQEMGMVWEIKQRLLLVGDCWWFTRLPVGRSVRENPGNIAGMIPGIDCAKRDDTGKIFYLHWKKNIYTGKKINHPGKKNIRLSGLLVLWSSWSSWSSGPLVLWSSWSSGPLVLLVL